jgi:hypothetical protein
MGRHSLLPDMHLQESCQTDGVHVRVSMQVLVASDKLQAGLLG